MIIDKTYKRIETIDCTFKVNRVIMVACFRNESDSPRPSESRLISGETRTLKRRAIINNRGVLSGL